MKCDSILENVNVDMERDQSGKLKSAISNN